MLNLVSNFLWISTLIGSLLGDNKEWDCCLQYSQGFHFSWPAGNEFELLIGYIRKNGLLLIIVVWGTFWFCCLFYLCRFCALLGRMMEQPFFLGAATSRSRCGHLLLVDNQWLLRCTMHLWKILPGYRRWIF